MGQIIDLFGLPGSGKTTFCSSLILDNDFETTCYLKLNGTKWKSKCKPNIFYKLKLGFYLFNVKSTKLLNYVRKFLYKNELLNKETRRYIKSLLIYTAQIDMIKPSSNNNYITDNGFFQIIVSLLFEADNLKCNWKDIEDFLNNCVNLLNISNDFKFVYISTDVNTCVERILTRDKNIRVKGLSITGLKKKMHFQDKLFKYIYQILKEKNLRVEQVSM